MALFHFIWLPSGTFCLTIHKRQRVCFLGFTQMLRRFLNTRLKNSKKKPFDCLFIIPPFSSYELGAKDFDLGKSSIFIHHQQQPCLPCFNLFCWISPGAYHIAGELIGEVTTSASHGTKICGISINLKKRNVGFNNSISVMIRTIPRTRPRRLFRSPITSPSVYLSGTVTFYGNDWL